MRTIESLMAIGLWAAFVLAYPVHASAARRTAPQDRCAQAFEVYSEAEGRDLTQVFSRIKLTTMTEWIVFIKTVNRSDIPLLTERVRVAAQGWSDADKEKVIRLLVRRSLKNDFAKVLWGPQGDRARFKRTASKLIDRWSLQSMDTVLRLLQLNTEGEVDFPWGLEHSQLTQISMPLRRSLLGKVLNLPASRRFPPTDLINHLLLYTDDPDRAQFFLTALTKKEISAMGASIQKTMRSIGNDQWQYVHRSGYLTQSDISSESKMDWMINKPSFCSRSTKPKKNPAFWAGFGDCSFFWNLKN